MGQIRAFLPLIGGIVGTLGITLPAITDSQLSGYISAAMVLFGLASYVGTAISSYRQKIAARRAEVAAAVASAKTGVPVLVTETPAGQPNVATRIAPAEIMAAPPVSVILPS